MVQKYVILYFNEEHGYGVLKFKNKILNPLSQFRAKKYIRTQLGKFIKINKNKRNGFIKVHISWIKVPERFRWIGAFCINEEYSMYKRNKITRKKIKIGKKREKLK